LPQKNAENAKDWKFRRRDAGRKRAEVGKGGKAVGKRTGFAHLFPHDSTQVVDFPRMYDVRVFLRAMKFSFQSQAELGTEMGNGKWSEGVLESWESQPAWRRRGVSRKKLRVFAGKCAKVRGVSRKFAQNRAVNPRCLASQARHKLDAPSGLFACAKRGRIVTGESNFLRRDQPMKYEMDESSHEFGASKSIKLTIGKWTRSMLETPSAFGRKWLKTSGINLCHSIAVCAQSPPWVGNATCSNASSGWACSKTRPMEGRGTHHRPAEDQAGRVSHQPDRERRARAGHHRAFAICNSQFPWFACRNFWRKPAWPRAAPARRLFWKGGSR